MLNIQEVYEQYFTVVYRYLLSLSHNTHIAEELTQETFFKALKKVDDFRGDCDLRVWLCQISKNTYYDYLKKNKKYAPESQRNPADRRMVPGMGAGIQNSLIFRRGLQALRSV